MLKSYFITTLRSLRKHPVFTVVNVAGLSVGIAAFILITLFIRDELTFDKFHKNHERVYRGMAYNTNGFTTGFPDELVGLMESTMPNVESIVRISGGGDVLMEYEAERVLEKEYYQADPEIFDIFDFPLKYGNATNALMSPDNVVISKFIALKYFGVEDAVGRTLKIGKDQTSKIVSGVLDDIPTNSRFKFNMISAMEDSKGGWRWAGNGNMYALLKAPIDESEFSKKVMDLAVQNGLIEKGLEFPMENFGDLYFKSRFSETASGIKGNKEFIYIFAIVGALLLILGTINYVNSATAKSLTRLKEIGVRKVVGASKYQLRYQLLLETSILALLAIILASGLAEYFLPTLNELTGKELGLNYFSDSFTLIFLILLVPGITLMAGVYPAIFTSKFQTLKLIKGEAIGGKSFFRKYLVGFQLTITLVLLFGTQVIKDQVDFFMDSDLGMNPSGIVSAYIPRGKSYDLVKETIEKVPGVEVVTSSPFPSVGSSEVPIKWTSENEDKSMSVHYDQVATNALDVLDIQMIAGRGFMEESEEDMSSSVILSESVVKEMGLKNPVGQVVQVLNFEKGYLNRKIIGVFKDFQFNLKRQPLPRIMIPANEMMGKVNIKIQSSELPEIISGVSKAWEALDPNQPFTYSVMADEIEANYEKEKKFGTVIQVFTWVAMLIAGLGLFSLSAFTIIQKYKEIGIRKVLGASVFALILNLLRSYIGLVILASLIAIPLTYYLMNLWMDDFVNHIEINYMVFAIGIGTSVLIVLMTVGYQSIKASLINPVDILRDE